MQDTRITTFINRGNYSALQHVGEDSSGKTQIYDVTDYRSDITTNIFDQLNWDRVPVLFNYF